ncbi:hypothetical protein FHR24_002742 [Wenyingzhuangia heitensis]|uniref:Dolichyl-phosphate-mannose-protein mannosyltransferase n=1 Tax=Wenyingzhuangia heitensis TaxID=1487859 RepID=A0ABX0UBQ9_9FLAO|nr:hypothetical protein [Wenyingzhuangia heitensis]NIJ46258.1 hypothetical protein [Wenyingzhuangia heitensis]
MSLLVSLLNQYKIFLIGVFLVLISFLVTYDVPFFWDALSKSERATWFYEHNFSNWVVPTEINSGHPPFWTLLLAFTWKIFGRTLLVSRLLLLLLNIGVVYQIHLLITTNKIKNIPWYWYLILFIEPTYLAQTTILNNDVLMLLMCLAAYNLIKKNRLLYSLAITGVLFCNLRGMFFYMGFFAFDIISYLRTHKGVKNIHKHIYPYIFPISCFALFLFYQYSVLGWIIKSPSAIEHRSLVDVKHFFINIIATIRVFADYGRFLFWIVVFYSFVLCIRQKKHLDKKTKELVLLWLCFFVINVSIMLLSTNPIGHRYFMILYIIGLLIFVNVIFNVLHKKRLTYLCFWMSVGSLLSGHFWIYPETISQGWDSSLAYLNYFDLKKKMHLYVKNHQISLDSIGTKTWNPKANIEYLQEKNSEVYIGDADSSKFKYYVHSNVENRTKDEEIFVLQNQWTLIKEYKKNGVFVRLYKSPGIE